MDEEKRIGVFICHCGTNIAGVIDVKELAEYAKDWPNVAHAQDYTYIVFNARPSHDKGQHKGAQPQRDCRGGLFTKAARTYV